MLRARAPAVAVEVGYECGAIAVLPSRLLASEQVQPVLATDISVSAVYAVQETVRRNGCAPPMLSRTDLLTAMR